MSGTLDRTLGLNCQGLKDCYPSPCDRVTPAPTFSGLEILIRMAVLGIFAHPILLTENPGSLHVPTKDDRAEVFPLLVVWPVQFRL